MFQHRCHSIYWHAPLSGQQRPLLPFHGLHETVHDTFSLIHYPMVDRDDGPCQRRPEYAGPNPQASRWPLEMQLCFPHASDCKPSGNVDSSRAFLTLNPCLLALQRLDLPLVDRLHQSTIYPRPCLHCSQRIHPVHSPRRAWSASRRFRLHVSQHENRHPTPNPSTGPVEPTEQ